MTEKISIWAYLDEKSSMHFVSNSSQQEIFQNDSRFIDIRAVIAQIE